MEYFSCITWISKNKNTKTVNIIVTFIKVIQRMFPEKEFTLYIDLISMNGDLDDVVLFVLD